MVIYKQQQEYFFYLLILFIFVCIFISNPFLHLPYDVIAHLIAIDEIYHGVEKISVDIPPRRLIWHTIWANIFHLLHIESIDFLLRTKIIHVVQTIISLSSVYFFSYVVIKNIFYSIPPITLKYLSLWSSVIWLSIFSTFSLHYHQVWILWYSINYQITLPLFLYIMGLTLIFIFEHNTKRKKIVILLQIIGISWFILQAHAMEFMYYIMYIMTLSLIYFDKTYNMIKRYQCRATYGGVAIIILISMFKNDDSKFSMYFMRAIERLDLSYLYKKIIQSGEIVVSSYNRSSSVLNELIYTILSIGVFALVVLLWNMYHKKVMLNKNMYFFVLITSLFVLIPLYVFPAGLFGLITRENVVHRIYYSASLFVLLPISVYFLVSQFTTKLRYTQLILIGITLSVFFYSKSSGVLGHNYYKNIISIQNSFFKEKVGFNLSQEQIDHIGEAIKGYERQNTTHKETLYFARYDIAFVLKYIYGKKVWWKGRKENYNHSREYWDHYQYQSNRYFPILYRTHGTFPPYRPYQ